ncbi:MFS transporter [Maribacter sp. 2304DJ31-5]|uniref:MFS transporter n=1 Tax=Maribacter sp. 2304DJ31-5 TaxID=3386273 RepID=UPI0039BC521F
MFLKSNLRSLQNTSFRWLFLSQAINLLGDALSWTGLALLAHKIAGENATNVLSISLTIRVLVFVVVAPYSGVLADKLDRKKIMLFSHFIRMVLVALLPFAFLAWHIYGFVFIFSIFSALFTPTFKASVIQVFDDKALYPQAISLSSATYQLLGILGPGLAGGLATFFNIDFIFWIDALTFVFSAIFILMVPMSLKVSHIIKPTKTTLWKDIKLGSQLLFKNKMTKQALFMQLVVALVGAQVLVNTIFHIKETLSLEDKHYGWVMSAMGLGAVIGALLAGSLKTPKARLRTTIIGAILGIVCIAFANEYNLILVLIFWGIIGVSESLVNIPVDTLIADTTDKKLQGRVYGAHFSWSHLWWVVAYPIAGLSIKHFPGNYFLIGAGIAIVLWIVFLIKRKSNK